MLRVTKITASESVGSTAVPGPLWTPAVHPPRWTSPLIVTLARDKVFPVSFDMKIEAWRTVKSL